MSNNHLYAKRKSDGKIVSIDEVANGNRCGCICTKCNEPLTAKNGGEVYIHHFAHSGSNCPGETKAHLEAKEIIKREKYLWLPDDNEYRKIEFDDIEVEKNIGNSNYSADLICTVSEDYLCITKGEKIAVEIVVTHDLDDEKEQFLHDNKIDTLSIFLGRSLNKDEYNTLPNNFSDLVLKDAHRYWVVNEKIRKKEEDEENERIKRDNEEYELFLNNGGKELLEEIRKERLKEEESLSRLNGALKEISKKNNSKKLIYGNLTLADCRKYGGWQDTLCVKSDKLSPTYENLAIVEESIEKYKDYIGVNVGFKIIDEESRYDVEMPSCKVLWNKRDEEKIKRDEENALPNFINEYKDFIDEFQNKCGYNKKATEDLIRSMQSDPIYNRDSHIISRIKKLIEDAKA